MKLYFCYFIIAILYIGCSEETPVATEGNAQLTLKITWAPVDTLLPLNDAKVIISSDYGTMIRYSDSCGIVILDKLPSSYYNITVRKPHPADKTIIIAGSIVNLELFSGKAVTQNITAKPVSGMGLCINEIYFAGPVNDVFYFSDQFIELYNSSDSTKYLDGIIVMRVSGNGTSEGHKGPGADEDDDNDIDGITYAFRFPGNFGGTEYPINPKSFITLACDAYDHRKMSSKSIDLSKADWEFYNQFSPDDFNNTSVPNLRNMIPEKKADFLISLMNDVILISTGMDSVYSDGIDISTIIDGIEYQSSRTSRKTLDARIDRSYIISPSKYSGRSVQRREPGLDSNNGTLDWEILSSPTPSYQ